MPTRPERVLILAPNDRDAELTRQTLEERGLTCHTSAALDDFLHGIVEGAGLGVLAEEALDPESLKHFSRLLTEQAPWSDFPLILIAARNRSLEQSSRRYALLQQLGSVTILERPFFSETLISAVISALRSRRRQYEARARLIELQQREDMITELNKHLEGRVIERTRELTNSQDALVQAQKLEAIGRLAGGVAHDFNNLITGIMGIVEDVSTDLGPKNPHHEDLAHVITAAKRAALLTRQLLAFGRRQVVNPKVITVNPVVRDLKRLFSGTLPANVEISYRFSPGLGKVLVDKSQLEQVLLNLVLNARDAMPQGGKIKISTLNVALGKNDLSDLTDVEPGRYVSIQVADTGTGIDAEIMKHLFEPFYTTKGIGTGTGMGLATAYGLIKQHGGDIGVTSVPGKGATFKIYLPRLAKSFKVARRPAQVQSAVGGAETILVTEDEDIVRKISVRALEKRGYRVIQARDARAALKLSKAFTGHIDLLLTDVVMPGMTGQELAAAFKLTRPETRVLYMSGYSREMITRQGVMEAGTAFIEKAFSAEKLCSSVRQILDQSAAAAEKLAEKVAGKIAMKETSDDRAQRSI